MTNLLDPLILAARANDLAAMRQRMRTAISTDVAQAAMVTAAEAGHHRLVRLLLPNVPQHGDRAVALAAAIAHHQRDVVRVLAPLATVDRAMRARAVGQPDLEELLVPYVDAPVPLTD